MSKKILILGGTAFVGRALVEKLLGNSNYSVTLFNRGKTNDLLFRQVEQIFGDRNSDDILKICDREWDAIIDFCGYYPKPFKELIYKLKGKTQRYIFISSLSVYPFEKVSHFPISEKDETLACTEYQLTTALPDAYGEKKAEIERMLISQNDFLPIIFRPAFIYGKYEYCERFYYWFYQVKKHQHVIVPQAQPIALTYAADLVAAIEKAITTNPTQNIYNTVSHSEITLSDIVENAATILGKTIKLFSVEEKKLNEYDLSTYDFPLAISFKLLVEHNKWINDFKVEKTSFLNSLNETIAFHKELGWHEPKIATDLMQKLPLLWKEMQIDKQP